MAQKAPVMTPHIHIHITSPISVKDGQAAYAATIHTGTHAVLIAGTVSSINQPRPKLTAIIRALQSLQELHLQGITSPLTPVTLHVDSSNMAHTLTSGAPALWKANGWTTSPDQPVRNRDLWEQILTLTERMNISYS